MKKWIIGIVEVIGAALLFLGIYTNLKDQSASSISIIGGADGPTSIFLAGKVGSDFSTIIIAVGFVVCVIGVAVALYLHKRHSKD